MRKKYTNTYYENYKDTKVKEYLKKTKEHRLEYGRDYYSKHKEKRNESSMEYYYKNRDKINEKARLKRLEKKHKKNNFKLKMLEILGGNENGFNED